MEEYKLFFHNYFDFKGKASRKEFWNPKLAYEFLVFIGSFYIYGISKGAHFLRTELLGFYSIKKLAPSASVFPLILFDLMLLFLVIPMLSLSIRRFRDAGVNPGWYIFQLLVCWYFDILILAIFIWISLKIL